MTSRPEIEFEGDEVPIMHTPLGSVGKLGAPESEASNQLTLDYVKAPPRFEKLAYPEWREFVKKFRAYRQRRGRQPIKSQFGDDVLTVLELRIQAWDTLNTDEEVFNAVDLLYAPGSKLETIDRLEGIKCATSDREFSLDAIVQLINAFKEIIRLSMAAGSEIPGKMVRKLFIKAIKPERLRMVVEAEEPKSWTDAARFAINEVERFSRNAKELTGMTVKYQGTASSNGSRKLGDMVSVDSDIPRGVTRLINTADTSLRKKATIDTEPGERKYNTRSKEPVCYGCGRQGHTRNKCRFKDVPGFQAEGFTIPPKLKIPESFKIKSIKPASNNDNLIRVPVKVAERTVQALIDTGSAISTVSPDLVRELSLQDKAKRIDKSVITANKSVTQCDTAVPLQAVIQQAVPVAIDHEFIVMDTGESLLLGMDVLLPTGLLHQLPIGSIEELQKTEKHKDERHYSPNEVPVYPEEDDVELEELEEGKIVCDTSDIIAAHHTVFDEGQLMLGARNVPAMEIRIKDGSRVPHAVNPRQMSPNLKEALRQELMNLEQSGIIKKMDVSQKIITTAPIVMVKKKDNTWRLCVDYRNLNKVILPQPFPMENVQDLLRRLQGAKIFAVLDLKKGFHQMALTPDSAVLTAFTTPFGIYKYQRVPMGLITSPAYFQSVMSGLFGHIPKVAVYIDDIIIYGETEGEFKETLNTVLRVMQNHNLKCKLQKCKIGVDRVQFLGHIVDGDTIRMSKSRIQGVMDMQCPKTIPEVRTFLGVCNYFRKFVSNLSVISKPLTELTGKKKMEWSEDVEAAVTKVKQAISNVPSLFHINYDNELILRTDASEKGIGGMLLQLTKSGQEQPICFMSKSFNSAQQKWSTIEQECFGIVHAILNWADYLLGHHFIIETDHRNLIWLQKATTPKLIRWGLRLQEFDFTVKHIAGSTNQVADGLSRCLHMLPEAEVISKYHNSIMGHRGIKTTIEMMRADGLDWKTMKEDTAAYIKSCPICQKVWSGHSNLLTETKHIMVQGLFESVAMDFVGPFPEDEAGNRFIIAAIDQFSRFLELKAVASASAIEAATFLFEIAGRYGVPTRVKTDYGSHFHCQLFEHFAVLMGCTQEFSIPYRHESNGIVERCNKEIGRHLRAIVNDRRVKKSWSTFLPLVQRIINTTPHVTIGTAPYRLVFGDRTELNRNLTPMENRIVKLTQEGSNDKMPEKSVQDILDKALEAQRIILDCSEKHQRRMLKEREADISKDKLREGDLVLLAYPERSPSKLSPRWRGPLVVVSHSAQSSLAEIQCLLTNRIYKVHVNRLKLFDNGRDIPPANIAAVDIDHYTVENITGHRIISSKASTSAAKKRKYTAKDMEFRVKWLGYGEEDDTWIHYSEIKSLSALEKYLVCHDIRR